MYLQGGLKRSVTTLRGGTLGYAEIVAVKVIHRASIYNIIGDCRMMLLYGSYLLKPIIQNVSMFKKFKYTGTCN